MDKTTIKRKNMELGIEDIKKALPHRYPFLLVDRIIERDHGMCTGIKNVTVNEPFFEGHFPGQSIMPGMLLAEAMAQTAAFVGPPPGEEPKEIKKGFLTSMNIKMKQPVIPGDCLLIKAKVLKSLGSITKFKATAFVDNDEVAEADFNVALIE